MLVARDHRGAGEAEIRDFALYERGRAAPIARQR